MMSPTLRRFQISLSLSLIFLSSSLGAQQRYVCRGRALPTGKDRKVSSHRLECSGASFRFVREPQKLSRTDLDTWRDLKRHPSEEKRKQMQALWQKLPLIQWTGTLPYETVEKWDWQEWVYGQAPVCGYKKVKVGTRQVAVGTDKKGNTKYKTEDVYEEVMKSCWHDETRFESRFCTNETMTFKSEYIRPSTTEWGPGTSRDDRNLDPLERYNDVLPNQYDLLPGEVESVQIFNGASGTTLNPTADSVEFGDAWNQYSPMVKVTQWTRGNVGQCQYDNPVSFEVKIKTDHRVMKTSPNAFRLPVDKFGRPERAVDWSTGHDSDTNAQTDRIPRAIKLMETSALLVESMAEMSRTNPNETGARPSSQNLIGDQPGAKPSEDDGFYADPQMRVKLYEFRRFARDMRMTKPLVGRGAELAKRDFKQLEDRYEVDLLEHNFYTASGEFMGIDFDWVGEKISNTFGSVGLRKGNRYYFEVSMRNPGVPFYYANKFSKPMQIWVPEQDEQNKNKSILMDSRPLYQKLLYLQDRSIFTKVLGW